ncbi:MAG: MerR family transcriptional regulator [Pseudonocardiaceae bacterium]
MTSNGLMTVGELSRRTGVPIKNLRQYTDWGLINTVGRHQLPVVRRRRPVVCRVDRPTAGPRTDRGRDPRTDGHGRGHRSPPGRAIPGAPRALDPHPGGRPYGRGRTPQSQEVRP